MFQASPEVMYTQAAPAAQYTAAQYTAGQTVEVDHLAVDPAHAHVEVSSHTHTNIRIHSLTHTYKRI